MACPYCNRGDVSVEIFGFAVHKLSDRWIACTAKESCTPFYDGVIETREDEKTSRAVPRVSASISSPTRPQLTTR